MLKRDSRLGQYKIVRFLGEGGMGAVYEAVHVELNKRVAVKTLRTDVQDMPTVRERFLREGQAAARIKHPHIVDVYDAGQADGTAFLVMEFLEGEDLEMLLRRETRISAERALDIMVPVMAAVYAVHQQGIIHRDLKPQNIFLTRGPYGELLPKVLDFGISKVSTGDAALTGAGEALGSPYYMSPEQARGVTDLDPRSDQFGLGVILYELLTGVRPFDAPNVIAVLFAIQTCQPMRLSERLPGSPAALDEALARSMSREAADRFPTVLDFGRAVLPFAGERTRVLWAPLLGASAAPAPAPEDLPPLAAEDRTSVIRNPLAETGPRLPAPPAPPIPLVQEALAPAPPAPPEPVGVPAAASVSARLRPLGDAAARPPTDPRGRPLRPPPPPGAQPRPATPPPARPRPATDAARSGSHSSIPVLRPAVGPSRSGPSHTPAPHPARERNATPPLPVRSPSPRTPPLPQPVPSARRETPSLPLPSARRETPPLPQPVPSARRQTPILPLKAAPAPARRRRHGEPTPPPAAPPPSEVAALAAPVDDGTVLCIPLNDPGATLRARQLIRTSPRPVMLFETKGANPEKRAPLCHILGACRGALDVIALVDDGKGGWRDPMGDLCKELAPDRYEAKNSYLLLQNAAVAHLVRKDLFDPLTDAEKVTDWVAGRNPAAQRYRRSKE